MDAKEYLEGIEDIEVLIRIEREELSMLWERATSCTAPTDKEPSGSAGVSDPVGTFGTKLAYLREETERRIDSLIEERNRRIEDIKRVSHPKAKYILYRHYVEGAKFCDIALEIRFSKQRVNDFRQIGEDEVQNFINFRTDLY